MQILCDCSICGLLSGPSSVFSSAYRRVGVKLKHIYILGLEGGRRSRQLFHIPFSLFIMDPFHYLRGSISLFIVVGRQYLVENMAFFVKVGDLPCGTRFNLVEVELVLTVIV